MPTPTFPEVSPAESGAYQWALCGRIASGAPSVDAIYGADDSIVSLDEQGAVRAYARDASSGVTLATVPQAPQRISLVANGTRLVVSGAERGHVLGAAGDAAIGVGSGPLATLASIAIAAGGCNAPLAASEDGSRLVSQGDNRVCVWSGDDGAVVTTILLPKASTTLPTLAAPAPLGKHVFVFRDGQLARYAPSTQPPGATLEERFELGPLLSIPPDEGHLVQAAMSADSRTLLLFSNAAGDHADLMAVDTTTGTVRWRQSLPTGLGYLAVSPRGYVLVGRDSIYRIDDGQKLGPSPAVSRTSFDLSANGRELLERRTAPAVWDLERQTLVRLYGPPSRSSSRSLAMSGDGRTLAVGGLPGVVWQLAPDFSQSVPLFDATAEGAVHVALSPTGDQLLLSGDLVALAGRDGVPRLLGDGGGPTPTCWGDTWAFAPSGCFVAGFHDTKEIRVHAAGAPNLAPTKLPTRDCGSVAFSPDGSRLMTANLELFDTRDWSLVWSKAAERATNTGLWLGPSTAVAYSPDGREVATTRCGASGDACVSSRYDAATGSALGDLPRLSGRQVRYSPEGHWVVSGNSLQHLPSGKVLEYAQDVGVSIFTPEGDLIAATPDGALERYCRSSK